MAISIQELRKPEPEFTWQAPKSTPFGIPPVSNGFPWQVGLSAVNTQNAPAKPRSRGILKFVNYLYGS